MAVDDQIVGPRRRMISAEWRSRERLAEAKLKRTKRHKPKNHSTNRERSREARAKAEAQALKKEKASVAYRTYLEAVRAYWRGDSDSHPRSPAP